MEIFFSQLYECTACQRLHMINCKMAELGDEFQIRRSFWYLKVITHPQLLCRTKRKFVTSWVIY